MQAQPIVVTVLLMGGILTAAVGTAPPAEMTYTADFSLMPKQPLPSDGGFIANGSNPFFSLKPGHFLRLEGEDDGLPVAVEITVLKKIRPILFEMDGDMTLAVTRVVEEREWIDGQLSQVSLNYFARSAGSDDIYYFGEDVTHYEAGQIVDQEGSWLAGEDGALPGLFMPGLFLLGSRYQQENSPGVSMDRAEHLDMGLTIETAGGVFEDCVVVLETTPLEPDEETIKIYAPGVGLIVDDGLELVEYHP